MKMHISEFARLCGVSVRTLRYYDQIGLLTPSEVDGSSGYRYYDRDSLKRMQEILFYRELDFPLREIDTLLSSSEAERQAVLLAQRHLLTLKKERLERLISALDDAVKGEEISMKAFDNTEFETQREKYAQEVKDRWGQTDAYRESQARAAGRSAREQDDINASMDSLMAEFAQAINSGASPSDDNVQKLVGRWQEFISLHYYTCTREILAGLGQMYAADERFRANIDRHGEGTAQFMSDAIRAFCG